MADERPRGLVRVYAMARPRRPSMERDLVAQAAAAMKGSARARASRLAAQVAAETVRYVEQDPTDDLTAALVLAEMVLAPSPILLLATAPEVDTAELFLDVRTRRYRDRACRQLSPAAWEAETAAVAAEVADVLAERYRRHLLPQISG